MAPTPPNYAVALADFGQRLFGDNWQGDLSRLTGANRRTVVRCVTAAREGRDYPAARAILAELYAKLAPITADLKAWS